MPDQRRKLPAAGILFLAAVEAGALFIQGSSSTGMEFRGELEGVTGDALLVREPGSHSSLQIGIPFSSLEALAISLPDIPDASTDSDLESLLPVLPLMDPASWESLLTYLNRRGDRGDWTDVYVWTRRLETALTSPALLRRIRLLKARSLHALGLYRQLEQELASLGELIPPVEAPPLYCWLQASLLVRRDAFPEAGYWARLPFLKIPVPREPVMDRLAELGAEIEKQIEPRIP
jgi:hypothetical protein